MLSRTMNMSMPHSSIMSPNASSKGGAAPPQHQYLQQSANASAHPAGDTSNRRPLGSAAPRSAAAPRNMQHQRKQNRASRRPRLEDDDAIAEHTAIKTAASRRGQTSITHLMSFALPPRPPNTSSIYSRNNRRNPTWGVGSGHHAVDKARYIHANYRFVVDPRGDYRANLVDSDVYLDWEQVVQVLATLTEDTSCPICLCTPVAPRMSKCGHIFCLPCLIRYMHASDDTNPPMEKKRRWKSCPICFDSMYMHEMKSVRWLHGNGAEAPMEGSDVVLRLMMRRSGSTLALPRDVAESTSLDSQVPWYSAAEVLDFAHYMRGSEDYMQGQYDAEIAALQLQETEDELMFGEEVTWTRKAVATINDLKERAKGIGGPGQINPATVDDANISSDATPFYFYQAPLHSYLSPLDIRVLKSAFGDFSSFPATLLPRVEHVSTGHVVDDDIRKRAKYLAHLPLGHEINFLECDWTDIVPPEILDGFANDLERRRRQNQDKANREEKARVRAEQSEDKKWYGNRRERPIAGKGKEPEMDAASADELAGFSSSLDLTAPSTSPPWLSSDRRQGSSFASLASPGTSPTGPRTVWGTPVVTAGSPSLVASRAEHDTLPENDGWLQNWENDILQDDDLIAQAKALSLGDAAGSSSTAPAASGKKKKKQKITLMSTNARRAA